VNRFDALGLEPRFQPEVEIRRVHADEHVGALLQKAVAQLRADA